jgi:uncharacterized membrane protein
MAERDLLGIATTVQISGHPIHPLLVPLPIGFLVGTFLCDLAYMATGSGFWAEAAFWSLVAAIVTAALAALVGFIDFFGNARIRALSDAWLHMIGNVTAVVLALLSLLLRWGNPEGAVLPWGLLISTVIVLLILFTGWMGGELAYRHRVGMLPDERQHQ